MKRIAALLIVLCTAAGANGCASAEWTDAGQSPVGTQVRCQIFEVPAEVAEALVPVASRRPVEQSPYTAATVPVGQVKRLAEQMQADSGLLVDKTRPVSNWPRVADSWAYTKADGRLSGGGGGAGFMGVRERGGAREVRIEYQIDHALNATRPIHDPVFYQGPLPAGEAVVFLTPADRTDGQRLTHVVAFEVADAE
jgi:hypothetical protein